MEANSVVQLSTPTLFTMQFCSQIYLKKAWHNRTYSLIGKPYLAIISSNERVPREVFALCQPNMFMNIKNKSESKMIQKTKFQRFELYPLTDIYISPKTWPMGRFLCCDNEKCPS